MPMHLLQLACGHLALAAPERRAECVDVRAERQVRDGPKAVHDQRARLLAARDAHVLELGEQLALVRLRLG